MLSRISIEVIGSSGLSGGRPRPSLKWQVEQERALKVGPKPSVELVDAGAVVQLRLNVELPVKNGLRRASLKFSATCAKAFLPTVKVVPSPPERATRSSLGAGPLGDGSLGNGSLGDCPEQASSASSAKLSVA